MAGDDYVLGTHDEEIERLGLQHRVWRDRTLACWDRAGIGPGQSILDIGAGPGFATLDLARIAGPSGRVAAFERSERFLQFAQAQCRAAGLGNVEFSSGDLESDPLPDGPFDVAWCRWVLCFLREPSRVVQSVAGRLAPGGRFVLHEYADYRTWTTIPPLPSATRFIEAVMRQWREAGGEPDIGRNVPAMLQDAGMRVVSAEPIVFAMRPGDDAWQWPEAFVRTQPPRLVESGYLSPSEANDVQRDLERLGRDARSLMLSPLVLEIIAERPSGE